MATEIKIPKLYRTETLDICGNKIKIKGYRGNDYAHVRTLEKIQNSASMSLIKIGKLDESTKDKKENSEWTDKEIEELKRLNDKFIDLKSEAKKIVSFLAQRGIKRFFYPGLNTEEIDKKPDIELDDVDITRIHKAMAKLSSDSPDTAGDVKGKGKSGKKSASKKK